MAFDTTTDRMDPTLEVVAASGDLDLVSATSFAAALNAGIDRGHYIVVDLSAVTWMDSSGLRVLVAAQKRLVAQNRLLVVVCNEQAILRNRFEITGLLKLLNVVVSLGDGIALVRSFRAA